jgi:glycerol uptake facilitator-like aquaporin
MTTTAQRLTSEFLGSSLLLATVVGSGIMGQKLTSNEALVLLCNALATASILIVLVTALAPLSGAHLNPAVTIVCWLKGDIGGKLSLLYVLVQFIGAAAGVVLAHFMFELPLLQFSDKVRSGCYQMGSEAVATFGLVLTILMTAKAKPSSMPVCIGLYIFSAYWFTASTSFANPAVTFARALTDTFAGIRWQDVTPFILAQVFGALSAFAVASFLLAELPKSVSLGKDVSAA